MSVWHVWEFSSLLAERGFCNYEMEESSDNRGQYNWTEHAVSSEPLPMQCVYGALDETVGGMAMATRECGANLMWEAYDGSTCATLDIYELRSLSKVSVTR